jgi:PAS domain S-box-containing protein
MLELPVNGVEEMLTHGGAEQAAHYLAAIVDSSNDAILSVDLGGTITSWNKGAGRLLQYTPAEVVGRPIIMLIPPERRDDEPAIIRR